MIPTVVIIVKKKSIKHSWLIRHFHWMLFCLMAPTMTISGKIGQGCWLLLN